MPRDDLVQDLADIRRTNFPIFIQALLLASLGLEPGT